MNMDPVLETQAGNTFWVSEVLFWVTIKVRGLYIYFFYLFWIGYWIRCSYLNSKQSHNSLSRVPFLSLGRETPAASFFFYIYYTNYWIMANCTNSKKSHV